MPTLQFQFVSGLLLLPEFKVSDLNWQGGSYYYHSLSLTNLLILSLFSFLHMFKFLTSMVSTVTLL